MVALFDCETRVRAQERRDDVLAFEALERTDRVDQQAARQQGGATISQHAQLLHREHRQIRRRAARIASGWRRSTPRPLHGRVEQDAVVARRRVRPAAASDRPPSAVAPVRPRRRSVARRLSSFCGGDVERVDLAPDCRPAPAGARSCRRCPRTRRGSARPPRRRKARPRPARPRRRSRTGRRATPGRGRRVQASRVDAVGRDLRRRQRGAGPLRGQPGGQLFARDPRPVRAQGDRRRVRDAGRETRAPRRWGRSASSSSRASQAGTPSAATR